VDDVKKFKQAANVKNIELLGPSALYFANKPEESVQNTYEITDFTFLLMVKLNITTVVTNNTLFEILCNTLSLADSGTVHPTYNSQVISINFGNDATGNVKIEVRIGRDTHKHIFEFQRAVFNNIDMPVLITLSYNKTTNLVTLIVGSDIRGFTVNNPDAITLGSAPFILNKGGEIDMNIYSMAFYNKELTHTEIDQFKRFNEYHINGISQVVQTSQATASQLAEASSKLKNLETSLSSCQKSASTASTSSNTTGATSTATATVSSTPAQFLPMKYAEGIQLPMFGHTYKDFHHN
jgi:hypothetical protein